VTPSRIINATAPIRICDIGGWTDTWVARRGQVFNIAVQPLVIAGLFLLPPAAAVAAFATVVALAVALPVAAVLSVGTGPGSRVGAPVLGAFVVVAYLVGLAWGANAVWRAPAPPADDGGASGAP